MDSSSRANEYNPRWIFVLVVVTKPHYSPVAQQQQQAAVDSHFLLVEDAYRTETKQDA